MLTDAERFTALRFSLESAIACNLSSPIRCSSVQSAETCVVLWNPGIGVGKTQLFFNRMLDDPSALYIGHESCCHDLDMRVSGKRHSVNIKALFASRITIPSILRCFRPSIVYVDVTRHELETAYASTFNVTDDGPAHKYLVELLVRLYGYGITIVMT